MRYYFSIWLNKSPILINPVIPTIVYIIFDKIEPSPKIYATKLKSNNPINPQTIAPIIVKTKQIFCNISKIIIPFYIH